MNDSFLERFNNLSTREKIISLATLLIIVWGGWDKFVYLPIMDEQKKLTAELTNVQLQLSTQHQTADQIEALGKQDPNKKNKQTLKQVKDELNKLKLQLDIGEKKFVPAHLMAQVLQDILKQNSGLNLVSLKSLPVIPFSESKDEKSWVYQHGLSITVSGTFFNTLNYLKSLESLPWRFNWESIDYQVKDYPKAEVTLHAYTLSFEENWLGL